MDRFRAMSVFSRVAEQGSFARAAERLGISTSAASRYVAELETHLRTRLLNRTTRRLSLTEDGQAFLERCTQLLADLEEVEQTVTSRAVQPTGTLRLTCAINFGVLHVAPAVAAFLASNPQVKFDIALSDRLVDLVEEGYDLGIRIGELGSQNLIAKKLGETRLVPCASPAYLAQHGTPRKPEDLVRHRCLTYEYMSPRFHWRFRDGRGRERRVRIAGPLHANNGEMLAAAAVQGVGISLEPDFIVAQDLRAGRLVRLLENYAPPVSSIYAVYPSRRHVSAKVRGFVDFLTARFRDTGAWA